MLALGVIGSGLSVPSEISPTASSVLCSTCWFLVLVLTKAKIRLMGLGFRDTDSGLGVEVEGARNGVLLQIFPTYLAPHVP